MGLGTRCYVNAYTINFQDWAKVFSAMNFVIPIGGLFLKSWKAKNYPSVLTCLGEESIHATYNPCGFENIAAKWVCFISQGYIYKVGYNLSGRHSEKMFFLVCKQKEIFFKYSKFKLLHIRTQQQGCHERKDPQDPGVGAVYGGPPCDTLACQKSTVALNSVLVSALNSHSIDGGSTPHTFT